MGLEELTTKDGIGAHGLHGCIACAASGGKQVCFIARVPGCVKKG